MSDGNPAQFDEHERDHFLSFHRKLIRYDNGYWVTFRVTAVDSSPERPHGFQYSLSLHDEKDDRILGYNNAHLVSSGSGPAKRSKSPVEHDHINRRGRRSVPYTFTTPYKLLEDFFTEVDKILRKEGVS